MSDIHNSLSKLVVRNLLGQATPEEIVQLEEWASLSVENRIWLKRFNDEDWLLSQFELCYKIDVNECAEEFSRRLDARKIKKAKVVRLRRRIYQAAGVLLFIVAAAWMYKRWIYDPSSPVAVAQKDAKGADRKQEQQPSSREQSASIPEQITQPVRAVNKRIRTGKKSSGARTAKLPVMARAKRRSPPVADAPDPAVNSTFTTAQTRDHSEMKFVYSKIVSSNEIPLNKLLRKGVKTHAIQNLDHALLKEHHLPDNSNVSLNAMSEMNYPYSFDSVMRWIEIKGEAYFEVRKNDSLPFFVLADSVCIESTGGDFNVRSYSEDKETEVTALKGKLIVVAGLYHTTLEPGQSALITKGGTIEKHTTKNAEKVIAWTKGLFFFDEDNISSVGSEIARWYGLTFRNTGKIKTGVRYNGLRKLAVTDVIKQLKTTDNKTHLKLQGKELITE